MIKHDVTAPRLLARSAGMFILLTILGGLFAQGFVSDRLIAGNDGAVTALNILEHKLLFKWASPSISWRWPARSRRQCSCINY